MRHEPRLAPGGTLGTTMKQMCRGKRFGRWVVIGPWKTQGLSGHHILWLCRCECGVERWVNGNNLRTGQSRGCGCVNRRNTVHGAARKGKETREHRSWRSMKERCTNPKAPKYHIWGGRGVRVCKRWQQFAAFLADMGPRPAGTSLDRINPNGDYTPRNCRWATAVEQRQNRRRPTNG